MFTYLLRLLALLGFFLASPAFADCPGFYTGICKENGSGASIILGTSSGVCSSGVIVETSRSENATSCILNYFCSKASGPPSRYGTCGYLKANYIPTPTPSPAPTPAPTFPPCTAKLGPYGDGLHYYLTSRPAGAAAFASSESYCVDGCEVTYRVKAFSGLGAAGECFQIPLTPVGQCNYSVWLDNGHYTGKACTASGQVIPGSDALPIPPTPVPSPPPPGKCKGEFNGAPVTYDCVTTSSDTKTKTETDSDGNKKTTTTETSCTSGTCTSKVTETTKDSSGNTVSSSTREVIEKQNDFCTSNPNSRLCAPSSGFCEENRELNICKDGSYSGGATCDSPPTCTGDPVQCAQAKESWRTYCESKKTADALTGDSAAYSDAKAVVDAAMDSGGGGEGGLTGETFDLSGSSGAFNAAASTNPFGSACVADAVLGELNGHPVAIPFSTYCSTFRVIGHILVAFSLLGATLFAFRT